MSLALNQPIVGSLLGGGMTNNAAGSMLDPMLMGAVANAPAPTPELPPPSINWNALSKVSHPEIQKMVLQWLMGMAMQREQARQAGGTAYTSPEKAGEDNMFAPGTITQRNLATGEVKIIQEGKNEGLSSGERIKTSIELGERFRADPRIKDYSIIERSERGMAAALKLSIATPTARLASDQTLAVLFQKMLDPGSVVRESEYARTGEGASYINRIIGMTNKVRYGGLGLTNEDRTALVSMSQKLLGEAKITFNKAYDEYATIGESFAANKRTIFGSAKPFNLPKAINGAESAPRKYTTTEEKVAELRRRGVDESTIQTALDLEKSP